MREDSPAVTCKSPLLVGSGLSSPFASSPSLYTASLASSCKSASPGIPQRLRLHLPDPTDSRARSGQLVWRKIGSHKREGGAWAALAAALETILIKSCVVFSCVDSRGRSLEDLAWTKAGSHARSFLVWEMGIA